MMLNGSLNYFHWKIVQLGLLKQLNIVDDLSAFDWVISVDIISFFDSHVRKKKIVAQTKADD